MVSRVFLDTNVWFSALYGSKNCQKIIDAHTENKITAIVSEEVLTELLRNLKVKIPYAFALFERILINSPPEVISDPQEIPKQIEPLIHQKDQGIFAAAILANVDYFVTGNIKDFQRTKLQKLTKIKIMTPKELVAELKL